MKYVCPKCGSEDWVAHGKSAACHDCGNTSKLEDMSKVVGDQQARNLNEIMPEEVTCDQAIIQINE